mmetsp:Transcript_20232/g.42737  ORF Transcript_20232/g.42737 Transcript_20232/m.42737 type:complete len:298 (+) Transcript_20232:229-1122(+)
MDLSSAEMHADVKAPLASATASSSCICSSTNHAASASTGSNLASASEMIGPAGASPRNTSALTKLCSYGALCSTRRTVPIGAAAMSLDACVAERQSEPLTEMRTSPTLTAAASAADPGVTASISTPASAFTAPSVRPSGADAACLRASTTRVEEVISMQRHARASRVAWCASSAWSFDCSVVTDSCDARARDELPAGTCAWISSGESARMARASALASCLLASSSLPPAASSSLRLSCASSSIAARLAAAEAETSSHLSPCFDAASASSALRECSAASTEITFASHLSPSLRSSSMF